MSRDEEIARADAEIVAALRAQRASLHPFSKDLRERTQRLDEALNRRAALDEPPKDWSPRGIAERLVKTFQSDLRVGPINGADRRGRMVDLISNELVEHDRQWAALNINRKDAAELVGNMFSGVGQSGGPEEQGYPYMRARDAYASRDRIIAALTGEAKP